MLSAYFNKNNLLLLRVHFSIFLLPIFLFAHSQIEKIDWMVAFWVFIILHLIVYPSSNAYNSYMDQDETSIGGLEHPPKATDSLLHITYALDILGILLSFLVSNYFALFVFVYICISRFYSGWGLRLKQYPILGYLAVVIFQGYFIYQACVHAQHLHVNWLDAKAFAASLLLGAVYPLTQIYQHKEDKERGDTTISMALGIKGTFIFTMLLFGITTLVLFVFLPSLQQFILFNVGMLPGVLFFFYWMLQSFKDRRNANFKNTMRMNILSAVGLNISFLLLLLFR